MFTVHTQVRVGCDSALEEADVDGTLGDQLITVVAWIQLFTNSQKNHQSRLLIFLLTTNFKLKLFCVYSKNNLMGLLLMPHKADWKILGVLANGEAEEGNL